MTTDNEHVTARFDQTIEATLDYDLPTPTEEDAERGTANLYYYHQLDTFIVDLRTDAKLLIMRAGFHRGPGAVTIPPLPGRPVEGEHLKNVPPSGVTTHSAVHTENILDSCNTFSGKMFIRGNIQAQRRMKKKDVGVFPALTIRAEGRANAVECSVGP